MQKYLATNFLKMHNTGFVATIDDDNRPWGSAVYYASDDDQNIYFFTKNKTRKAINIRRSPHVSFVVFDQKDQTTIQMTGTAYEVDYQLHINMIYKKLSRAVTGESHPLPITKLTNSGDYIVFKISPDSVSFVDYSKQL